MLNVVAAAINALEQNSSWRIRFEGGNVRTGIVTLISENIYSIQRPSHGAAYFFDADKVLYMRAE